MSASPNPELSKRGRWIAAGVIAVLCLIPLSPILSALSITEVVPNWMNDTVSVGVFRVLGLTLAAALLTGHWERFVALIRAREVGTSMALYRMAMAACIQLWSSRASVILGSNPWPEFRRSGRQIPRNRWLR